MATSSTCLASAPEHLVGLAELLSDDGTVGCTDRVEKGERDRLATKTAQRDRLTVLVDQAEGGSGCMQRAGRPIDRRGQDGIRSRRGSRLGHGNGAHQDNADGGRSGDEPERIARAGNQTLPPGNRVGGHLDDGDDSVGDQPRSA